MTQLVCPLCGRFVSLAHFDPSGFDSDIYIVEVTGLGRGRGVKVSAQYSILKPGDPTVELIKDRILELSKVLLDSGCMKPNEALSSLRIKTASPQEVHKLKNEVEVLEVELENTRSELLRERMERESLAVELEDARGLNAELKRELSKKRGEVGTLEAELEDLRERYNTVFIQLEEKGRELSGLYEEISEVVNSIEEALTAGGEAWIWEIDEEEEPLEALRERLQDLINEYEALEAEVEGYG